MLTLGAACANDAQTITYFKIAKKIFLQGKKGNWNFGRCLNFQIDFPEKRSFAREKCMEHFHLIFLCANRPCSQFFSKVTLGANFMELGCSWCLLAHGPSLISPHCPSPSLFSFSLWHMLSSYVIYFATITRAYNSTQFWESQVPGERTFIMKIISFFYLWPVDDRYFYIVYHI